MEKIGGAAMSLTFKCGHEAAQAPAHMGRGQARKKRLTDYFGRNCSACAERIALAHLASLTDSQGNPRPANQEKISTRLAKIRATYDNVDMSNEGGAR